MDTPADPKALAHMKQMKLAAEQLTHAALQKQQQARSEQESVESVNYMRQIEHEIDAL
ncbi:hypothetical protein IPJ72_06360 [Candidatus Peregrinibacteria bacterium]|nr:MAG: hypothetical protein IPJ72_06360 [Candidatus Peregrinibacteria bacterium]